MRLDAKVTELLQCSKTYAQSLIKQQKVQVNGQYIVKNAYQISINDHISILDEQKFVSRGAYKLLDALESFNIDVSNKIVADIGASTGGFSDVVLQNNCQKVYALDVGQNQLHAKIKNNPKVIAMEHLNCRYLDASLFSECFNFVVMDVSFISVELIIPSILSCCSENVELVILVKPQFEVGKQYIGKNGIVKNEKVINNLIKNKIVFFNTLGLTVVNYKKCQILGKDGNQEYLFYLKKGV